MTTRYTGYATQIAWKDEDGTFTDGTFTTVNWEELGMRDPTRLWNISELFEEYCPHCIEQYHINYSPAYGSEYRIISISVNWALYQLWRYQCPIALLVDPPPPITLKNNEEMRL